MKQYGIQLNPQDGDLLIDNGSIQTGVTLQQNQSIILVAQKGELKEYPLLGVGISDMLHDEEDKLVWKRKIREEFNKDGMKVRHLTIDDNSIKIEADYE